ncbi:MAG: UDP-N-acetylglucosamine 2-epimerase (non-hydrolyzing) [Elusimicrobiota bacterium]
MHILHVVGARPNFMKAAPVLQALRKRGHRQTLVHTGQHYDANMSDLIFRQLGLPEPDHNLEVGSLPHAAQTAQIMVRFEEAALKEKPDLVLVYGDVNSTVAAALVCAKLPIPVGHVEAGLRSGDRSMPEEINRLLTDQVCDLLFTPSMDGDKNLLREGVAKKKIRRVGNVMIDTLVRLLPKARPPEISGLEEPYVLVTLHRPSNVDEPASLKRILHALREVSGKAQVVFPVHPRTRKRIQEAGIETGEGARLFLLEPVGYLEFLALQRDAAAVVTDSGGIQEESSFLRVPCLTVRENTERPITLTRGTNTLVGTDMGKLARELAHILAGKGKKGSNIPLWDGKAAERLADSIA